MGIRIPQIKIIISLGDDNALGELSLLTLGFALHQAWVYSAMFGTKQIFGTEIFINSISLMYLTSILIYGVMLILCGLVERWRYPVFSNKKVLISMSICMALGTFSMLLIQIDALSAYTVFIETLAGVLTGVGSAFLIIFWGITFSRCDSASIVLNTAFAIPLALIIYAIIFHLIPFPLGSIITGLFPIIEMFILLSILKRVFNKTVDLDRVYSLPVKHGEFLAKLIIPVTVFGIAIGILRRASTQEIITWADQNLPIVLLTASAIFILLLFILLTINTPGKWSRFFRPLIPFIAITVFFLPLYGTGNFQNTFFLPLIGYMCFEALIWIFFGEMSQGFRLSPIMVFGIGRGSLELTSLIGYVIPIFTFSFANELMFGKATIVLITLAILVISFALLPRESEIATLVKQDMIQSQNDPNDSGLLIVKRNDDLLLNENGTKKKKEGSFTRRVKYVADKYLLSVRETDVLFLLAKGFNSAYIQEELYIAEGTAKTHIRHIYRKTNVNSQQELMRLVEDAPEK